MDLHRPRNKQTDLRIKGSTDRQTMGHRYEPRKEGEQRHRQSKGHADGPKDTDLLRKGKDIQMGRQKETQIDRLTDQMS